MILVRLTAIFPDFRVVFTSLTLTVAAFQATKGAVRHA